MTLLAAAQSALDPAGPQAGGISRLWWVFFYVTATIYLLVLIFMAIGILRRKPADADGPKVHADPVRDRRMGIVVGAAVGISLVILLVFLVADFLTGQKLYALGSSPDQIEITIIGHQWWWEVQYEDPSPSKRVRTANEIHIPTGTVVKFDLKSRDVIHSFWVPDLHGKKDLIPGHPTHLWLRADDPGTYSGQCAEFCGHQHAHMRFSVVAEDRNTFNAWLDSQRKPATQPSTDSQKRGQVVFLSASCVLCHTIDGTPARAQVGPPLTHIGSARSIAANTLPNNYQNLRHWIRNPQDIKPGVLMPQNNLSDADLDAVADYLESLK